MDAIIGERKGSAMPTDTNFDYIEYDFTAEGTIHDITRFRSWITEEWRKTQNAQGFHTWRSSHRDTLSVRFYTGPSDPDPIPEVVRAFPQLTFRGSIVGRAVRYFTGRKGRHR
jgi:hypothetical protein